MDEFDDIELIACPQCKSKIFAKNVSRHYWMVHNVELSPEGKDRVLEEAKLDPVSKSARQEHMLRLENARNRERTPGSMRKYKGGPLGPERR